MVSGTAFPIAQTFVDDLGFKKHPGIIRWIHAGAKVGQVFGAKEQTRVRFDRLGARGHGVGEDSDEGRQEKSGGPRNDLRKRN